MNEYLVFALICLIALAALPYAMRNLLIVLDLIFGVLLIVVGVPAILLFHLVYWGGACIMNSVWKHKDENGAKGAPKVDPKGGPKGGPRSPWGEGP